MINIKALAGNLPQAQTDAITQNIVTKVMEEVNKSVAKRYHDDFDKIEAEFKTKAAYINGLEDRIKILEMKVMQLEKKGETSKEGQLPSDGA